MANRTLKDFLTDSADVYSPKPSKLLRTRSRAASTTILAIHKASEIVFNAVRYLPFASDKSPSILPRSISRRLTRKNDCAGEGVGELTTVTVKDILRWRSSRDLVEEDVSPLDFSSSPHHCTTATTMSTSTATSSGSSSWCESDFSSEDLPLWCGDSDEQPGVGKKFLPVDGFGIAPQPQEELPLEEKEQNSPVSVLDFPFGDRLSRFSHLAKDVHAFSIAEPEPITVGREEANVNGTEERTKQLVNHAKASTSSAAESWGKTNVEHLLLDFFKHELATTSRKQKDHKQDLDCEMLRVAEAWVVGEDKDGVLGWEMEGNREVCVRDMDRELRWNKFEEEQEEVALNVERQLLSYLVDELLIDLFTC